MKTHNMVLVLAIAGGAVLPAQADDGVLTGDTRLACEALLCLASPTRPGECVPSITRYFSISFRRISDTVRGRVDFLKLCPTASTDPNMGRLVDALANGAGRCDPSSLNVSNNAYSGDGSSGYISNVMPAYCTAYLGDPLVNLSSVAPVYVGLPERSGYWVSPADYPQALTNYNTRIRAEDADAAVQSNNSSGG